MYQSKFILYKMVDGSYSHFTVSTCNFIKTNNSSHSHHQSMITLSQCILDHKQNTCSNQKFVVCYNWNWTLTDMEFWTFSQSTQNTHSDYALHGWVIGHTYLLTQFKWEAEWWDHNLGKLNEDLLQIFSFQWAFAKS